MATQAHLTFNDRAIIQQRLNEQESFRSIAAELGKDPTTISKEVKNHIQFSKTGATGRAFNDCLNRTECHGQQLCGDRKCRRYCKFCTLHRCSRNCSDYVPYTCKKLSKPPYVCNGCDDRRKCTLEKRLYQAQAAQSEYEITRTQSRQGIQLTEREALRLDALITPLLKQGHSLHSICVNNADVIMQNERTLYTWIDAGVFQGRNIDMPRVVRMGVRKPKKDGLKIDKKCRIGRTYADYKLFRSTYPDVPVVEMDSVEGIKGGKVLLTLHFVVPQLMIGFIRDANTSQSVIDSFNHLHRSLGTSKFQMLFQILLGDNGSEFSNPEAIENDPDGIPRSQVFYCDAGAPYQKGAAENNHSLIRRILPKGVSFDDLTQADINLMMNHINSYTRKNLGDKSPYEIFSLMYGEDVVKALGTEYIPPNEVTLRPTLLK